MESVLRVQASAPTVLDACFPLYQRDIKPQAARRTHVGSGWSAGMGVVAPSGTPAGGQPPPQGLTEACAPRFQPQGRGRPGAPFVAFLGVQYYVENGRLIR